MKKCVAFTYLFTLLITCFCALRCQASEIIIVADEKLTPVVEIISGIKKAVSVSTKIISHTDVHGKLKGIVEKEKAKVVVALGNDALNEALQLPPEIPVIYDLVVTPPKISRANVTGFYMAIPVSQYLDLIKTYLRSIKRITVIGNRDQLNVLASDVPQQVNLKGVSNNSELVNALQQSNGTDAILILPDDILLTDEIMKKAYLLSFRNGIPLLGFSEKQVKKGALLALMADTIYVGKQIGYCAKKVLRGSPIGQLSPSPPVHFEIFLNTETAQKMKIKIPNELLHKAKRVYD